MKTGMTWKSWEVMQSTLHHWELHPPVVIAHRMAGKADVLYSYFRKVTFKSKWREFVVDAALRLVCGRCPRSWNDTWELHAFSLQQNFKKAQTTMNLTFVGFVEGYGHSMILLAYFLIMLSSANMKSDLLTVRQFCRWGTGLYRAMVRALCALACFRDPDSPADAASCPSPLRSRSPSPVSTVLGADSSPNRAILQRNEDIACLKVFFPQKT